MPKSMKHGRTDTEQSSLSPHEQYHQFQNHLNESFTFSSKTDVIPLISFLHRIADIKLVHDISHADVKTSTTLFPRLVAPSSPEKKSETMHVPFSAMYLIFQHVNENVGEG